MCGDGFSLLDGWENTRHKASKCRFTSWAGTENYGTSVPGYDEDTDISSTYLKPIYCVNTSLVSINSSSITELVIVVDST